MILFAPYLLDAVVSATELARREVNLDNDLTERLLQEKEAPAGLQGFMHAFCVESPMKQKVFLIPSSEHFKTQATVFAMILV